MIQQLVNGVPWNQEEIQALKKRNLSRMPLPVEFEKNDKPWVRAAESCPRCSGSGRYPSREYQGICLQCQGDGYIRTEKRILSDKEKAQRERAKARKAARLQAQLEAQAQERAKAEAEAEAKRLAEEEAKKAALSKLQWIGTVGESIELTLTLKTCKSFENNFGGYNYFQVMETPDGNKVIYSGSKYLFSEQDTITRKFKVKSHDENDYGKSTKVGLR